MRPCLDCGTPTPTTRCPHCTSQRNAQRWATKAGRYDAAHRAERRAWQPHIDTGTIRCWRCGSELDPNNWDLGHRDGQPSHPECPPCNRATAGR